MKIILKPWSKYFENDFIFKEKSGTNFFYGFDKKMKKHGIDVHTFTSDTKGQVDKAIFLDIPFLWQIGYWKFLLFNRDKSFLFCFESPLINPFNQIKFFYNFFKKVYTWNDDLVDEGKIEKFSLPTISYKLNAKPISFEKKKFACAIFSNKSAFLPLMVISPYKKNLYPERLRIVNYFEKNNIKDFHLYGKGWNKKEYFAYKGKIKDSIEGKLNVMSNYKFSFCFENCSVNGYITEKIFDAFKANSLPIYFGAPNINKYIPENCFIDYRKFGDIDLLYKFLLKMDKITYKKYILNASNFIKSSKFNKTWLSEAFERKFIETLS